MDQCVRGDSVEGQSASRIVQIHCHPVGVKVRVRVRVRGGMEGSPSFIVIDSKIIGALQTPGLIISSKPALSFVSFCYDSFVRHRYINHSSPLDLPVTATGQTISAQQLLPAVKPLWVIRVRLLHFHCCHLPVVVGQFEESVYCVCVHYEFTGPWWRGQDTEQFNIQHTFYTLDQNFRMTHADKQASGPVHIWHQHVFKHTVCFNSNEWQYPKLP